MMVPNLVIKLHNLAIFDKLWAILDLSSAWVVCRLVSVNNETGSTLISSFPFKLYKYDFRSRARIDFSFGKQIVCTVAEWNGVFL